MYIKFLHMLNSGGGVSGENHKNNMQKIIGFNNFIVDKFCRRCTNIIGGFKLVKHVYM